MQEIIDYKEYNLSQDETTLLFTVAKNTLFPQEKEMCYDLLLKANLGLVFSVIRAHKTTMEYKELFNQGVLGLRKAIEGFDLSFENQFNTYAYTTIYHRLKRYSAQNRIMISIPTHVLESLSKISQHNDDESMTGEEIAESLEMSDKHLNNLKSVYLTKRTFDNDVTSNECDNPDEDKHINEEIIERMGVYAPFEDLVKQDSFGYLHEKIKTLNEKEKYIIMQRFGLTRVTQTLQEVGNVLNISKEMVRHIEKSALKKLKLRLDRASFV